MNKYWTQEGTQTGKELIPSFIHSGDGGFYQDVTEETEVVQLGENPFQFPIYDCKRKPLLYVDPGSVIEALELSSSLL